MSATLAFDVSPVETGDFSLLAPVMPSLDGAAAARLAEVNGMCAAVRRGEEWAVRELHTRYSSRLTRYALVITRGDETAAADAVQNAFLKAIRSLHAMPDEDALWAWLARACRTSAADEGRRHRRYSAVLAKLATLVSTTAEAPPEDTEAIWHSALDRALAALKDDDRAILDARYTARIPLAEIAAAACTTDRAIESRLARLRDKLRQDILCQLATRRHED